QHLVAAGHLDDLGLASGPRGLDLVGFLDEGGVGLRNNPRQAWGRGSDPEHGLVVGSVFEAHCRRGGNMAHGLSRPTESFHNLFATVRGHHQHSQAVASWLLDALERRSRGCLVRFRRRASRGREAVRSQSTTYSIRDVAAEAGVSVGTVSNVLNRPEAVAPATRARGEKAIAPPGFVRTG